MDLGSIFLMLALVILVGLFLGRPFFEPDRAALSAAEEEQAAEVDHQRSALLAERDRLLTMLYELDFDYALGKIPQDDYPAQRAAMLQAGAEVLRRLDALTPEAQPAATAEARLEAEIAARRLNGLRPLAATAVGDEELEQLIAARRRAKQENAIGFCPKCGKPVHKSDKFCANCGKAI